jgi:hypothetical protein
MTPKTLALSLGCILLMGAAAVADTPEDGKGRYAMSPVEGGVLRLDKETGALSLCTRKADHWACDTVEDRTKVIDEKVARLETENQSLKDRLKSLEDSLATGKPAQGQAQADIKIQIPSEEEVDKALDYVERIFKKFRDRIGRLEKPEPSKPQGQGGSL